NFFVISTCECNFRTNSRISSKRTVFYNFCGGQNLNTVTNGSHRFVILEKMPGVCQYFVIQSNILRSSSATNIQTIIIIKLYIIKGFVDLEIVSSQLHIRLKTYKIVNGSSDNFAFFLSGANHINLTTHR